MVRAFFLALLVLTALAGSADSREIAPLASGNWSGGAYSNDATGVFSHCALSAPYQSGITMYIFVDRDYSWAIGFSSPNWNLNLRSQIPLKFRIDNGPWLDATANVITRHGISVPMSNENSLIAAFRQGRLLRVFDGKSNFWFSLSGTSRAVGDLASCVQTQLALEPPPPTPQQPKESAPTSTTTKSEPPTLSSGSGIIISADGQILTNEHVVEGCESLIVNRPGSIAQTATVVASDAVNDLALLKSKLQVKEEDVASIRAGSGVPAGASIAVYGFPLAGTLSSTGNIVSGNVTALTGLGDDVRFFQISAPIQPGNSGGPLLDRAGNVIGVVNSKLNELAWAKETGSLPQNVNFAIKASVVTSFLDAHSIDYKKSSSSEPVNLPTVTSRAKKFTAFVLCVPHGYKPSK